MFSGGVVKVEYEIKNRKRILLIGNSHLTVFRFRKEIIQKFIFDGHDVWVAFPNGPFGDGEKSSQKYGCNFVEIHMDRRGTNLVKDLILMKEYVALLRHIKPDVVLAYTVKPDIYGGIACRRLKIPFIPNITGLGKGLTETGVIQKITRFLYKIAVKKSVCIFFQNSNDKDYFDMNAIRYNKSIILPGSGVNLKEFSPLEYPTDDQPVRFIYIARVMKAKGIEEYFEAAKYLKTKYPQVEFHICGFCEENYLKKLQEYEKNKIVIYHGLVENIIDYQRISHCIVLPSFHPEGISNVLLEAAACARPIITTKNFGCVETVDDGITGFLIEKKNSEDLIQKMECFISMKNIKRREMGLAGYEKIQKEFNREIVVEAYIDAISIL